MKIIHDPNQMTQIVNQHRKSSQSIGFVPTMGYLHLGHEALLKKAREESDIVILSVFVNPLQFNDTSDFESYPIDEKRDQDVARAHHVDYLFMPHANDLYKNKHAITMHVKERTGVLCDRSRPGHFDGVITILTKLFNIVKPDYAYFGKKDAQQIAIVDLLIETLNFDIKLKMVDTVRESDGLAFSSRNVNLEEIERTQASSIYASLKQAKQAILNGEKDPRRLVQTVEKTLQTIDTGQIDYVDLLSFPELEPIDRINGTIILAVAIQFEKARLIDNIVIDTES
ncbi:pantoate--beta-alanine ligase [Pelagirhabdus alkalitolerans]|uniref:Pantothenate synthetase n=1 Tax=Pelagirhabdus alkalitolerans TaxID=1612202 RepID=A0A1G6HA20_9BACI|nr:pantoate--beta-alanine ligase [Pelagirhabdus alkalitolerans]SDB91120.1 pantoate--beta-alanine ligase [Pelagirhabdus alkalitolerans]